MTYTDEHMEKLKIGKYALIGPRRFVPDVEDIYYFIEDGNESVIAEEVQERLVAYSNQNPVQLIALPKGSRDHYQCGDCFIFLSLPKFEAQGIHIVNENPDKRQETLRRLEEILK